MKWNAIWEQVCNKKWKILWNEQYHLKESYSFPTYVSNWERITYNIVCTMKWKNDANSKANNGNQKWNGMCEMACVKLNEWNMD